MEAQPSLLMLRDFLSEIFFFQYSDTLLHDKFIGVENTLKLYYCNIDKEYYHRSSTSTSVSDKQKHDKK